MKTNVYVDGFNLYYGAVKGTRYKWLDVGALCQALFPKNQISRIRYFTSRVRATPNDPNKPRRQAVYIRALETIPKLSVHYGRFLSHPRWKPLLAPPPNGPKMVRIIDTKEKGSDVNLATWLLVDGFTKDYEAAIVVSNDTDLVEPIKIVQQQLGFPVGVLNPERNRKKTAVSLVNAASFYKRIRRKALADNQFPATLTDQHGTITKPSYW